MCVVAPHMQPVTCIIEHQYDVAGATAKNRPVTAICLQFFNSSLQPTKLLNIALSFIRILFTI